MKKFILAAAALAVALMGFGGLRASTTYASPAKVWIINQHVAGAINGGPVTFTPAGVDAVASSLDAMATASAGQISNDPANAGAVWLVVKTDGSTTAITVNGRGFVVGTVLGPTAGNNGTFAVAPIGPPPGPAGNTISVVQDAVAVESPAINFVGAAHDIELTASKGTVQEGATACAIAASQAAPTNGAGTAAYTDLGGTGLVGYMPTFNSSARTTLSVGNSATASVPSPAAGQQLTTMMQSDGKTIGAVDSYCGVASGSATLSAAPAAGEIAGVPAGFARTASITVTGIPAAVALTASPAAIACDGTATSSVTAKVTDSAGNNVADGTNVNFNVVGLGTANPINVTTKAGGASSTITPLPAGTAGVVVVVTSGSAQASIRIDCSLAAPTATNTPAGVPTSTPTATPTPPAGQCLVFGQKISLAIGILHRFGAHAGEKRYKAKYDLNHDGVINTLDLAILANTPTCGRGPRRL